MSQLITIAIAILVLGPGTAFRLYTSRDNPAVRRRLLILATYLQRGGCPDCALTKLNVSRTGGPVNGGD